MDVAKSQSTPVSSGVPQGSVLGPFLFTMFVNDIPSIVSSPVFMFADDTKIFHVIRNEEDYVTLRNDLNQPYRWSQLWQLKFNISKCKHLCFGPAHHHGYYYLSIDTVASYNDLGILFDDKFKFHDYTTKIIAIIKAN